MKEVDFLQAQKKDLNEKINAEMSKELNDRIASKLRGHYDSMIAKGFSDEQAWWLVSAAVAAAWDLT